MKQLDFETWRVKHNVLIGRTPVEDPEYTDLYEYFLLCGEEYWILSDLREVMDELPGRHDVTIADLLLHDAEEIFYSKPEGTLYLEFVDAFGLDATDDLMSIVRAMESQDDFLPN